MNAKDFALAKTVEIIQICNDLHYVKNKELRIKAVSQIEVLANDIEKLFEHLDLKDNKEGE